MKPVLIYKAKIINEGNAFKGSLLIEDGKISKIFKDDVPDSIKAKADIIDGEDKWVLPGVIDTHVHFRDPGMTQKADFVTESCGRRCNLCYGYAEHCACYHFYRFVGTENPGTG